MKVRGLLFFKSPAVYFSLCILTLIIVLIPNAVKADDIYVEDLTVDVILTDNGFFLDNIVVYIRNNTNDIRNIFQITLYCDGGDSKVYDLIDVALPRKTPGQVEWIPVYLSPGWLITNTCTEITVSVTASDARSVRDVSFYIAESEYYTVRAAKALDFGTFASAEYPLTIRINNDGTLNSSGVLHLGDHQIAEIQVGGVSGTVFSVDFDPLYSIQIYGPGVPMTVENFSSSLTTTGIIGGDGITEVKIGADLKVGIDQTPGVYEGFFEVTVNYQ